MPLDLDDSNLPSAAEYKRAILTLRPIHENHLEILKAHFQAPAHTTTMTQLADAVEACEEIRPGGGQPERSQNGGAE
jgi:hypothetical protein